MKTLMVIALTTIGCRSLFAQGTVNFANSASSVVSNALTASPVVAGTTFMTALYYLPDTGTAPGTTNFDASGYVLNPPVGFAQSGLFNGGPRTTPLLTPPGGSAYFQVRAWESAFGTSYEQVLANPATINNRRALAGTSNILRINTGYPQSPAPLATGLQGFQLVPLPASGPQIADFSVDPFITFNTVAGQVYVVEKTLGLNPANWFPLAGATNIAGTGSAVSVRDTGGGCLSQEHFRVRLVW